MRRIRLLCVWLLLTVAPLSVGGVELIWESRSGVEYSGPPLPVRVERTFDGLTRVLDRKGQPKHVLRICSFGCGCSEPLARQEKIHSDSTRAYRPKSTSYLLALVRRDSSISEHELSKLGGRCEVAISPDGRWIALFEKGEGTSTIHIINSNNLAIDSSVNVLECSPGSVVRSLNGLAINDDRGIVAGGRFDDPPGQLQLFYIRNGRNGCERIPVPDESFCHTYRLHLFARQYIHVVSEQFYDGTHFVSRVLRLE